MQARHVSAWNLEKQVIEIIGVELQVPRASIRPDAHIVDDLLGDSLSIARVAGAIEAQLGVQLSEGEIDQLRVWDIVRKCHKAWWHGANEPRF